MLEAERLYSRERLSRIIEDYLPSREILEAYPFPDPISLKRRELMQRTLRGADYSLVYSQLEEKLVMVPSWHPLNTTPLPSHGGDYGSGVFEGGSLEPVLKEGMINGANIVLHEPKMKRFTRSIGARDFSLPVPPAFISQGIVDLAAVLAERVLFSPEGVACRAYIRPEARPGMGGFGVGVKKEHVIDVGVTIWNWPYYFKDPERVYQGSGLVLAAFPEQRLTRITGKHASNYGEAGVIGNRARRIDGVDEALYFGPYLIRGKNRKLEEINVALDKKVHALLSLGVLADGPGEEIFAVTRKGEIWYPPMDVNRLGGTTLGYIVEHLAPTLGISSYEKPFSLFDLQTGAIDSLLFAGNAARVAPIGEIRLFNGIGEEPLDTLRLQISPLARKLVERYDEETSSQIPPSHPSLLTPVDFYEGRKAREVLDKVYEAWFR